MDIIFIRNLQTKTIIGVYNWERNTPQTVEIDLDIGLPDNTAFISDNIHDTIHYGILTEQLQDYLNLQNFLLLEALAEGIALFIIENFHAPWVKVSVSKPGILPNVGKVGITIERSTES